MPQCMLSTQWDGGTSLQHLTLWNKIIEGLTCHCSIDRQSWSMVSSLTAGSVCAVITAPLPGEQFVTWRRHLGGKTLLSVDREWWTDKQRQRRRKERDRQFILHLNPAKWNKAKLLTYRIHGGSYGGWLKQGLCQNNTILYVNKSHISRNTISCAHE